MKIVYTQDHCPGCLFTKAKLNSQNIPFREVKIGTDITKEEFQKLFPDVRSVPYVIDEQDLQ